LGAIGTEECLNILKQFERDPVEEVSETVEIALGRIKHISNSKNPMEQKSPYFSVDPAFPITSCSSFNVLELEKTLLDENLPLYNRYQAMFTLRDNGSVESIHALGKGIKLISYRHKPTKILRAVFIIITP